MTDDALGSDAFTPFGVVRLAELEQENERLRAYEDETWKAIAERAERRVAELEAAVRDLWNFADYPCESSKTGECDKHYHNVYGQAIRRAEELLPDLRAQVEDK